MCAHDYKQVSLNITAVRIELQIASPTTYFTDSYKRYLFTPGKQNSMYISWIYFRHRHIAILRNDGSLYHKILRWTFRWTSIFLKMKLTKLYFCQRCISLFLQYTPLSLTSSHTRVFDSPRLALLLLSASHKLLLVFCERFFRFRFHFLNTSQVLFGELIKCTALVPNGCPPTPASLRQYLLSCYCNCYWYIVKILHFILNILLNSQVITVFRNYI